MKVLPNEIFFAEVERMIAEGDSVIIKVKGNSMRPLIRSDRTSVRLSPCDVSTLELGDVVLFRYRGRHVMHRIIERREDDLLLAGDGNYKQVERCRLGDVVAKVDAVIRPDGKVIACDSRRWRTASRCWLALPQFVRRCILSAMYRLGFA